MRMWCPNSAADGLCFFFATALHYRCYNDMCSCQCSDLSTIGGQSFRRLEIEIFMQGRVPTIFPIWPLFRRGMPVPLPSLALETRRT